MSSCRGDPPCDEPRLWYSPTSDLEVEFSCDSPGPGWRIEPFIEEVGVDLDGRLRGPKGVFTLPTADTGLGPHGPLGPLEPVTDEAPVDTGLGFGPTSDTFAPLGTGETGGIPGRFVGPRRDTAPPPESPVEGADEGEPGEESPPADTGLLDTGLVADTFPTGETGAPRRDTGVTLLGPTADTGVIE